MAKNELEDYYTRFLESYDSIKKEKISTFNTYNFLSEPDENPLEKILGQRHRHREYIVFLATILTLLPLMLIISLIVVQIIYRAIYDPTFRILEGHELEVLAVSIFGEAIGILAIITKSLWDDTPYKDFLEENNKKKK